MRTRNSACMALNLKNLENKDANARQYVKNMKKEWGTRISTLCLVYNATGDPIEFIISHDYNGHLGPASYPVLIANGQWGGFLHVNTVSATFGS
ncbi:hypothetical protein LOK49_LG03G01055 [Camellia lanceoleosa]|uniref:Uncharacterized protein n=1 Tax=Camellia lanceoleosa TaxID=1840588 RepID=A0ACC0I8T1_9ERIC|nr:hypothetical protein LOK49_LG03G01055 [Camellia lanceoleosa]